MASLSVPVHRLDAPSKVRLMDPREDLKTILELIELGFGDELGPQGWKMLDQLRGIAKRVGLSRLLLGLRAPRGFVWEEEGRVVANLSLRRAYPSDRAGWIIGNVVVHPDFRRRGIGRGLMETGVEAARLQGARWVGLEVRKENVAARTLYEEMGFRDVGETVHLIRPRGLPWPSIPTAEGVWRPSTSEDARLWAALTSAIYGREQNRIIESRTSLYNYGGWDRKLEMWISGQREGAWLEGGVEHPRLAVHAQTDRKYKFHNWDLLVHPDVGREGVREAVGRAVDAVRRRKLWPAVTTVAPHIARVPVWEELGFRRHRVLSQMMLDL